METTTTPAARPGPARALASAMATIALIVASVLVFAPRAGAADVGPIPKIDVTSDCTTDPPALQVDIVLSNQGSGMASFSLQATLDGVASTDHLDISTTPVALTYVATAGQVAGFVVNSNDGPGAHFQYTYPPVDCVPHPSASIEVVCPAEPGGQARLDYHYANPSFAKTTFTLTDPSGPDIDGGVVQSHPNVLTDWRPVAEGAHVQATVLADGVEIASLDTVVDCEPNLHHVTVNKTVVGGTGNPGFDFQLTCATNDDAKNTPHLISTATLHDGESTAMELPANSYCSVHEVDPGPAWTTTQSNDGGPSVPSATSSYYFGGGNDVTMAFTNTAVPPVETTTTTSTTTTTPTTTTRPVDTTSTTAVLPPASIVPVDVSSNTDTRAATQAPVRTDLPAVATTPLARTGSNTTVPVAIGAGLVAAGLGLIGAARRARRAPRTIH